LKAQLDRARVEQILKDATSLRGDAKLEQTARENWYVLFGEELP
jgi:hypothetical protein